MKWMAEHFLSPLLAAVVALVGNYYLFHKPVLSKDYTQIGVQIVMEKDSPTYMRKFGYQLIQENSPIKIPDAEKEEMLDKLLRSIPANFDSAEGMTFGESFARLIVYTRWAAEVRSLCEACISKERFENDYTDTLLEIRKVSD
ncbi:hypothetical protein N8H22_18570 [Stutzerimonas stutzeri]|uniref:hypothetical protein n=1 Tax=Stutzerimonas sp. S1 TaxID=3030652 RepID=UPI0022249906|nr:hypothetical protein [Stutzerimonas sp. S1]MCW3150616.1 hypothetical protein [Stutzerimonas sp. S1]